MQGSSTSISEEDSLSPLEYEESSTSSEDSFRKSLNLTPEEIARRMECVQVVPSVPPLKKEEPAEFHKKPSRWDSERRRLPPPPPIPTTPHMTPHDHIDRYNRRTLLKSPNSSKSPRYFRSFCGTVDLSRSLSRGSSTSRSNPSSPGCGYPPFHVVYPQNFTQPPSPFAHLHTYGPTIPGAHYGTGLAAPPHPGAFYGTDPAAPASPGTLFGTGPATSASSGAYYGTGPASSAGSELPSRMRNAAPPFYRFQQPTSSMGPAFPYPGTPTPHTSMGTRIFNYEDPSYHPYATSSGSRSSTNVYTGSFGLPTNFSGFYPPPPIEAMGDDVMYQRNVLVHQIAVDHTERYIRNGGGRKYEEALKMVEEGVRQLLMAPAGRFETHRYRCLFELSDMVDRLRNTIDLQNGIPVTGKTWEDANSNQKPDDPKK
ncbi:hypothetical protein L596_000832 [Steinernema carpocapsae]|uniref:Uncharacterized protein n=1 Tax=Steinernema carpocapsae TaxID=34508 RepID=A0A4U8UKJ5_STECR|nr:hypothetical protein L596_000832 [Steinernema carpocapsae]